MNTPVLYISGDVVDFVSGGFCTLLRDRVVQDHFVSYLNDLYFWMSYAVRSRGDMPHTSWEGVLEFLRRHDYDPDRAEGNLFISGIFLLQQHVSGRAESFRGKGAVDGEHNSASA